MELVAADRKHCSKCVWSGALAGNGYCAGNCLYAIRTGHLRLYKDGKKLYDPQYCNKFEAKKKGGRRCKAESKTM